MKTMARKIILALLGVLLVIGPMLTITGCGKKEKSSSGQESKSIEESEESESEDYEL